MRGTARRLGRTAAGAAQIWFRSRRIAAHPKNGRSAGQLYFQVHRKKRDQPASGGQGGKNWSAISAGTNGNSSRMNSSGTARAVKLGGPRSGNWPSLAG